MNELSLRLHGVYEQASAVVMQDIVYLRGIWTGEVSQGNANEINARNAKLTLMFVRAVTGTYMSYLAFATLKTLVKLPCMSAFSFLDDVLPLFLKVVVSYNLFRTSLNLTHGANLTNGIVAGYLVPPVEGDVPEAQQEDLIPQGLGVAANRYVAGTIFPSIWNSILLYALNREAPEEAL